MMMQLMPDSSQDIWRGPCPFCECQHHFAAWTLPPPALGQTAIATIEPLTLPQAMEFAHVSIQQLAQMVSADSSSIRHLLYHNTNASLQLRQRIAAVLRVPLAQIIWPEKGRVA